MLSYSEVKKITRLFGRIIGVLLALAFLGMLSLFIFAPQSMM